MKEQIRQINVKVMDLEEEIQRLYKEKQAILKNDYQYLVGKCLKVGDEMYDLITSLYSVEEIDVYTEIRYECIRVDIDMAKHDFEVDSRCYSGIMLTEIASSTIPRKLFEDKFNECVKLISDYGKSI